MSGYEGQAFLAHVGSPGRPFTLPCGVGGPRLFLGCITSRFSLYPLLNLSPPTSCPPNCSESASWGIQEQSRKLSGCLIHQPTVLMGSECLLPPSPGASSPKLFASQKMLGANLLFSRGRDVAASLARTFKWVPVGWFVSTLTTDTI